MENNTNLGRWNDIVKANRTAASLSFPLNQPPQQIASSASLRTKFQPSSSFENDLASLLTDFCAEGDLFNSGACALSTRDLTPEEIHLRESKIMETKNVLFYNELRLKRISRIKSKAFRKREKKKKERSSEADAASDPHIASALQEKSEKQRIKVGLWFHLICPSLY
jgi:U3 small nucleolar RNA-associated protein 14